MLVKIEAIARRRYCDCEGENSCEDKGWIKMSKVMCGKIKNSSWAPMREDMNHRIRHFFHKTQKLNLLNHV